MKMSCVGALGLSVKSRLAGDDGRELFVTAQRGAASHHSAREQDREHQAPDTRASKIVVPFSAGGQIGRGVEE